MKKLPLGIQSIRKILEKDKVYIDKTGFVLARALISLVATPPKSHAKEGVLAAPVPSRASRRSARL